MIRRLRITARQGENQQNAKNAGQEPFHASTPFKSSLRAIAAAGNILRNAAKGRPRGGRRLNQKQGIKGGMAVSSGYGTKTLYIYNAENGKKGQPLTKQALRVKLNPLCPPPKSLG